MRAAPAVPRETASPATCGSTFSLCHGATLEWWGRIAQIAYLLEGREVVLVNAGNDPSVPFIRLASLEIPTGLLTRRFYNT